MDDETIRRLLEEMQAERRELRAARMQIDALVAERAQAAAAAPRRITVADVYDAYSKIRRAETSWPAIRNKLGPLVRRLGSLPVSSLTPTVWAEHVAVRKTQITSRDKPPADHSLNIELGRAKEMVEWAVRSGLADSNPLKMARKARTISARETFLTENQIMELLDLGVATLPATRQRVVMRAVCLCAYDGLMRLNEIRHLRRDRVERDGGSIELLARQTKSRKRRFVPVTPRMLDALRAIPPVLGSHQIFLNPDTGKLIGVSTIESWFRAACIASGVDKYAAEGERVVIHTLRHSGATAADARGASPMAIKEALGHASLATTEKYLHRHRQTSARELAQLMADGAEAERRGPRRTNVHDVGEPRPKVNGHSD